MQTFRPGDKVWLQMAGEPCEVRDLIGSGGQGQVYHTAIHGDDCAMKWYFPHSATDQQRAALERLIHKGPPNDRFLWPLDLATSQDAPGYGYIMPLRQARFRSMSELMARIVDPTFRTLTNLGVELADSFLRLHSLGLCYSDISFGNIFFDPETGEVSICDNDNVAVDGEGFSDVLGTPRFMAPEIVREEARPNIATDLYSLAVILFYIFMVHHPLEGRREREIGCMDLAAMRKLYGTEALFIFDPKHGANRPVPGVHNNATLFWNLYPATCATFSRARSRRACAIRPRGCARASGAPSSPACAIRFITATIAARRIFSPTTATQAVPLAAQTCWFCHQQPVPPLRLLVARHSIVLDQDTLLFPHHLDPNRRNDYSEVLAEMVPHPKRIDVWGLKNTSGQTWTSVAPSSGSQVEVASGKSVSLLPGLRIRFGSSEGTVL